MANEKFSLEGFLPNYQEVLKTKAFVLGLITDISHKAPRGHNSVRIPALAKRSAESRTIGSADTLTPAANVYTEQLLSIVEELCDSTTYDHAEQHQNIFDYVADFTNEAMSAIATLADETVLAAQIAAFGSVARAATMLESLQNLRQAIEDEGTDENSVVVAKASDYNLLVAEVKDFIRFDADKSGRVGEAAGMTIIKGNSTVDQTLCFCKSSTVYAWQNSDSEIMVTPNAVGRASTVSIGKAFATKVVEAKKGKKLALPA